MAPNGQEERPRPPASLNGADWGSSAAKRLVVQDMLDGLVPVNERIENYEKLYRQFYAHQPEFADFPWDLERYRSRFQRLQKAVAKIQWAHQYDKECFAEYRLKFPQQTHGPTGKPLWKDSEADKCLKEDMANGLHLQMAPKELFQTRPCYEPFGLRRFGKRIDQLREAAKPYGCNPMQAAAKREKKSLTKIKNRPEISRTETMDPYNNTRS